jgi:hypothetical protein
VWGPPARGTGFSSTGTLSATALFLSVSEWLPPTRSPSPGPPRLKPGRPVQYSFELKSFSYVLPQFFFCLYVFERWDRDRKLSGALHFCKDALVAPNGPG